VEDQRWRATRPSHVQSFFYLRGFPREHSGQAVLRFVAARIGGEDFVLLLEHKLRLA
jgi:hypothetical protein